MVGNFAQNPARIPRGTTASISQRLLLTGEFVYNTDTGQVHVGDVVTLGGQTLGGQATLELLFTPGGDGEVSFYRVNDAHAQNPRTALISSVAGDVITITTTDAALFFDNLKMGGVSYARIWNTTKNPDQSAWVRAQPANNQLQVLSAPSIVGWSNGETIEIGDPLSVTPGRVIAIDISPMLQNMLGAVFRQAGILAKLSCANVTAATATIDLSPDGSLGSFTGVNANAFDGGAMPGQVTLPCTMLSPVSDSNLVFLRENVTGANMGIVLASAVGVWV